MRMWLGELNSGAYLGTDGGVNSTVLLNVGSTCIIVFLGSIILFSDKCVFVKFPLR